MSGKQVAIVCPTTAVASASPFKLRTICFRPAPSAESPKLPDSPRNGVYGFISARIGRSSPRMK